MVKSPRQKVWKGEIESVVMISALSTVWPSGPTTRPVSVMPGFSATSISTALSLLGLVGQEGVGVVAPPPGLPLESSRSPFISWTKSAVGP